VFLIHRRFPGENRLMCIISISGALTILNCFSAVCSDKQCEHKYLSSRISDSPNSLKQSSKEQCLVSCGIGRERSQNDSNVVEMLLQLWHLIEDFNSPAKRSNRMLSFCVLSPDQTDSAISASLHSVIPNNIQIYLLLSFLNVTAGNGVPEGARLTSS
jgi:hypothetical protein